ncbi:MAG TPA: hypothetical protein VG097_16050 [Gemmata sp.]|jgi:hypothetical protein|nr:hypothetical protein [Gemmata sp.]
MLVRVTDYNHADKAIKQHCDSEWSELSDVLTKMPLHLKASDQAGKQGHPIFDPVGTNEHIRSNLQSLRWHCTIPIPGEFEFLGTDVDFAKNALVVEAQFSNYPFLLNNTIRSELFFLAGMTFGAAPTKATVIVTKARMFPASNSTLYYEQAVNQLNALALHKVFRCPIRLVGLFVERDVPIEVTWTKYSAARYSRTVERRSSRNCIVTSGATPTTRCVIRWSR